MLVFYSDIYRNVVFLSFIKLTLSNPVPYSLRIKSAIKRVFSVVSYHETIILVSMIFIANKMFYGTEGII